MNKALFCIIPLLGLGACDTSALREVEEAAATARQAGERFNAAAAVAEQAAQDPAGALRSATLSARFTRVATAEPNLFVLTDIATGCQYLATYAADGATVQSIVPRTAGGGAQACIAPAQGAGASAPDAADLVGKVLGAAG